VLVTQGRLSDEAKARIEVLTHSDDGFVIAEKDLELRGPGDFFGTRQSGLPRLRVGDLVRDRELMAAARAEAFRYVAEAPRGELDDFLEKGGWQKRFGLARVG
jgi:ATP-dependent DNA helicase RecG